MTNGTTDGNQENNQKVVETNFQAFTNLPISEGFNSIPVNWEIRNDDNNLTWDVVSAPSESQTNTAARMNFFSYKDFNGEYDYLITPALDMSSYTDLSMTFDVAYAPFSPNDKDGLIVAVSTDCGNSFSSMDYVYQKQGTVLATAPISGSSFIPSGRAQWRTETVDLSPYVGLDQVQVAFIGVNDYGNNLYVDNVEISGARKPDIDLAIASITSPSIVFCQNVVGPEVVVQNVGLQPITSFQLSYALSGGLSDIAAYNGPPIAVGEVVTISFSDVQLETGAGIISVAIDQVDGQGAMATWKIICWFNPLLLITNKILSQK